MFSIHWLLLGMIGSAVIAYTGYRRRSLSASGAWAAWVVGALYVGFGGLFWFGLLLVFYFSSSALSKYKKMTRVKAEAEAGYEKSGTRDAGQVLANGGIGLVLCLLHAYTQLPLLQAAFAAALAAATADTWATELGALSKAKPRSILTGRVVSAGTSGGITLLGTAAAAAGAVTIGVSGALLALLDASVSLSAMALVVIASVSGLFGAMLDSLLGATIQRMYVCGVCGKVSERSVHCGVEGALTRGIRLMNNDAVNAFSSMAAAIVGAAFYTLLFF